jgi:uncharacterized NAD(P)/FAD-binding protein YdhS
MKIAILGSGPSANYLLKGLIASEVPLEIVIYEARARFGYGQPYHPDLNSPSMLANIASLELPPLNDSLADWLRALPDARLSGLHVSRPDIHERAFLPRVALGGYFAAQFEKTRALGERLGHLIDFKPRHRCEDVICRFGAVDALVRSPKGQLRTEAFDHVVIATGHGRSRRKDDMPAAPAYPPPALDARPGLRIGILGSSLSGIDACLAMAARLGAFEPTAEGLRFVPAPAAEGARITLMSHSGLLPEADFYCPLPAEPPLICTAEALLRRARQGSAGLLDRAFELFARELECADAAYARSINLATANADDFSTRYFGSRLSEDPFAWARANYEEARRNARERRVVGWRYAILRMHEAFERIVRYFDVNDSQRFAAGLKRVFTDNYTAVPHASTERLLALRAAGVVDLARVGPHYAVERRDERGALIVDGEWRASFDLLIDARGQPPLDAADLPFPTLRMQAMANAMFESRSRRPAAPRGRSIAVGEDFRLVAGVNAIDRVYCMATPYLLTRLPFSQGLTSAAEIGAIVARSLIAAARRDRTVAADAEAFVEAVDLPPHVGVTVCANGALVYQPRDC